MAHVLVAGAGPVGMAVARRMADAAIRATVPEQSPHPPDDPRASTFHPPTPDRPVVAVDCVGDRAPAPHEANLSDIGQKYAGLTTLSEIMAQP